MSSSTGSPRDVSGDAPASANSNFTLLYLIMAVLVGVLAYMAIRYGRSVMSEWRQLQAAGHGSHPGSQFGLSMDDIAALPTFTYRALAPSPSPENSSSGKSSRGRRSRSGSKQGRAPAVECVVCLQELEDGDVVRVLPACRHFFHAACIDDWLGAHSSCPVCRAHPEPERGEAAVSPPLPQLRRCGVSPERPTPSRIFADFLARSPLRIGSSTSGSGSKEMIVSKSPSPAPTASDYVLSRSPSRTPLTHGRVNERWSESPSPQMPEILVVRSKSPSPIWFGQSPTRYVAVLEGIQVVGSASHSPAAAIDDGGD